MKREPMTRMSNSFEPCGILTATSRRESPLEVGLAASSQAFDLADPSGASLRRAPFVAIAAITTAGCVYSLLEQGASSDAWFFGVVALLASVLANRRR